LHKVIVVGASGHAKVVIDVIEKEGKFAVAGLVDTYRSCGHRCFGYSVLGTEFDLPALMSKHGIRGGIAAIGDNWVRSKVVDKILRLAPDFTFITPIHPSAAIARGVQIGRGTVIMAGVTINSDSRIGEHCIINTNCSVDHDNTMMDYASLAPGVITGGNVTVHEYSAISLGAKLIHGRTIGRHTVIGAGATVLEDIGDYCVAWGTPAKIVGSRKEGDSYL
jgi:sugar O-acyltransferase (sialic acid O-acetyltransferase NeuD family)